MKKILLAIDGSATSLKAADETVKLAQSFNSEEVVIISVVYEQPVYYLPGALTIPEVEVSRKEVLDTLVKSTEEMVNFIAEKFKDTPVQTKTKVLVGRPSDEIIKEANEGKYDLVVLGSRGLTGVQRWWLGTVSGKVVNNVKSAVMVVK